MAKSRKQLREEIKLAYVEKLMEFFGTTEEKIGRAHV